MAGQAIQWGDGLAIYAGALLAWVLGLYVITRGGPRPIPLLAGAATLTLVVYQVGQALGALAPNTAGWLAWGQRTWWGAALAPAAWLALALALAADEAPDAWRPLAIRFEWGAGGAVTLLGALFAATGGATDLVVRWDQPSSPLGPPHVPPGPLFGLYQGFVLVCLGLAVAVLLLLWRSSPSGSPLRARFGWLLGSAALFGLGGAYITGASGLFGYSALPGQALLSLGLVVMGWDLARYGALLAGEVVRADLVAFGVATAAVALGYGTLAVVFVPREFTWLERVLPALLLLVATHVLADRQNTLLDRLVYGGPVAMLRGRLRDLADRVVRQPDTVTALADVREDVAALLREQRQAAPTDLPATLASDGSTGVSRSVEAPTNWRVLVEGALRRLNDVPTLSEHPLLDYLHRRGLDGTPLERAQRLRGEIEAAVARLQPAGARPSPGNPAGPGGWLHYVVLHEAYVEGRPNKQVMQRYHLSESTFHRARRRAIDAVADDLHQRWTRQARV